MYCLFNGEYGEHDLTHIYGLDGILKEQKEWYSKNLNKVIGDYTVIEIEYDWGKKDQRWKIRCNNCGKEEYRYKTIEWRKRKGRAIRCECTKEIKIPREQKKEQELFETKSKYIGKTYNGWEIIDCLTPTSCIVKCSVCGRKLIGPKNINRLVYGLYKACIHPTDYLGEEWIGKKIGHLTVIGREGKNFVYKCDCGNKRISSPSLAFRVKAITNCGQSECPYMDKIHKGVAKAKEVGQQYEQDMLSRLIMQGYNAKMTRGTGDYGVDIIVTNDDGSMIAIQCKYQKSIVGVEAIQAVYAGGRFYDCTKFAVISNSGFSNNAILMAKKLGIYLSDGNFVYPKDIQKYCTNLLPVFRGCEGNKVYYEIDGEKHTFNDWCAIYGKTQHYVKAQMKKGISFETALKLPNTERSCEKKYTINGFTGTKKELCKRFGVSEQLLRYRLNNGMELQQALTEPKKYNGRSKKVVTT